MFKIGDVVESKVDSPRMVVTAVNQKNGINAIVCRWYDKASGNFKADVFSEFELITEDPQARIKHGKLWKIKWNKGFELSEEVKKNYPNPEGE